MKLKKFCTLLFIAFNFFIGKAQVEISGRIVDNETKIPLFEADVKLSNSKDGIIIEKTVTDTLGIFFFREIPQDDYVILINASDYEERLINVKIEGKSAQNIGEISLLPITDLAEAVITGEVRTQKLEDGSLVMKVANNKELKTTTNLYDVLRRTPGVTVDQEGIITIGSGITPVVFINGKPMLLSGQELQNYLNSLSPEMVESITLNTNPSAKYDGEYKGIIDIKLLDDKSIQGLSGNYVANTSLNKYIHHENNLGLTYRTPKTTYTTRLGYDQGAFNYQYSALQHLASKDIMQTRLHRKTEEREYWIHAGIDYTLNQKHNLSTLFRGNFSTTERLSNGSLYAVNESGEDMVFDTKSYNPTDMDYQNFAVSLNYTLNLANSKLNFLGNFFTVTNKQKEDFINSDNQTSEILDYWKSDLLNKINIYTIQTDFSQKFGEGNLEVGIKYSSSDTDNNLRYETLSADNTFEPDPLRSNVFKYQERISAAYFSYSHSLGKLQLNGALRIEHTNSIANAITIDSLVERNYAKWLPSFETSYSFNKSSQLSLSFSRKLTRPPFSQLNPFRFYFSALNYWIGNPYLQPATINQFKLIYRQKNLISTFGFGKEEDMITRYPIYNPETNELAYLGTNIPFRKFAYLEISFPVKISKWWSMNYQLGGYFNQEHRPYLEQVFSLKVYDYRFRLNQTFTLPESITLNLYTNYESKTGNSLYIINPRGNMDVSIQKTWFNDKLNTKFAFNDIFDTFDQKLIFRNKEILNNELRHWFAMQKIVFSLSYNFGKSNQKTREYLKAEEENRL